MPFGTVVPVETLFWEREGLPDPPDYQQILTYFTVLAFV